MNRVTFDKLMQEKVFARMEELLLKKGAEYADDADRLINFKRQADKQGQTPLDVWKQFYGKHTDSVDSYVRRVKSASIMFALDDDSKRTKGGVGHPLAPHEPEDAERFLQAQRSRLPDAMGVVDQALTEPIEGRLLDIMVYCALGVALIQELREGEKK